jgi:CubicO group peptidase (beta-lactamase class C family)
MHGRRRTVVGAIAVALVVGGLSAVPAAGAAGPLATPPPTQIGVANPAYAQSIAVGQEALSALVSRNLASSVSVALTDANGLLWSQVMGQVAGTPATLGTLMSLGSVSKNLAAVAVMQLVDAGRVRLDAPVTSYIPDFTMASPAYRRITVRMLLDHTAGIPGTNMTNAITLTPWPGYAQATLGFLASQRLKFAPGTIASYCNDCYTLASVLVERVSGQSYPDYVRDRILTPLGMGSTRFATAPFAPGTVGRVTLSSGATLPVEYDNFYAAGGAYSTPTDMAALARMYLNGGVANGSRILSRRAIAEMGTWQVADTVNVIPDDRNTMTFGLGWDSTSVLGLAAAGVRAWQKGGDSATFHSAFVVAPDSDLAVVVQGTGYEIQSSMLEDIAQAILLQALVDSGQIDALPPPLPRSRPAAVTPTTAQTAAILGDYPQTGFRYRVVAGPGGGVQLAKLTAKGWKTDPEVYTLRTDGLWWNTGKVPAALNVARARGTSYLLMTLPGGDGTVWSDTYLGQRTAPGPALSPAWQARLAQTWVPVNQAAVSWFWFANPARRFVAIPGLPGYLVASSETSSVPVRPTPSGGAMFLRVPGASAGVDIYDARPVARDGQEWMWFATELTRPVSGIPAATADGGRVRIGPEGYVEWRTVQPGTVVLTGDVSWRLFDASLTPVGAGSGPSSSIPVAAAGYLALFGLPGTPATLASG